jgi:MFS family permease
MWRTSAVVLICGSLVLTLGFGIRQSFGLFLEPMSSTFAWPREVFGMAMALQNLLWGLAQPFAGAIADRYGAGRVVAVGGVGYVAGVLMMSVSSSPGLLYVSAGLLLGLAVAATSFSVVLAAVARSVPEERCSMALGLASVGGSLGQFAFPPFTQWLIADLDWAMALVVLALISGAIVPLAAALAGKAAGAAAASAQSLRQALGEARRHGGYWYLNGGFFVCGFHVAFIATHLPVFITSCGLSPMVGATSLGLLGLFNMAGTMLAGHLGGRYRKKYLLSGIYAGRAAVIALFFIAPKTEPVMYAFAAGMGLLWLGTVPLTSGLVAQIFGTRYMATLQPSGGGVLRRLARRLGVRRDRILRRGLAGRDRPRRDGGSAALADHRSPDRPAQHRGRRIARRRAAPTAKARSPRLSPTRWPPSRRPTARTRWRWRYGTVRGARRAGPRPRRRRHKWPQGSRKRSTHLLLLCVRIAERLGADRKLKVNVVVGAPALEEPRPPCHTVAGRGPRVRPLFETPE